ncbi:MAG: hypothetical protein EZS28_041250 [Streblomastix strix]|uniref:Uncharacterized protein n=1 Tax=Streblomastix strix TaxID=222440 RepID=A0A5J4TY78_9EUKA|nr:MAG: hypothetical protein EZS28_041250 [Streblomastix strix]
MTIIAKYFIQMDQAIQRSSHDVIHYSRRYEDIGYILDLILEEVPEQFHQHLERYLYLKSSSSSLTKTCADIPRDSFEIPYIIDYPTYIWAYDLSSHPELLMATYPLKSNTQLNKSVVKPYKTVSDLDQSLMYLQNESLTQSMDVLKFIDSLYASFLRKEEFIHSAELHITYSIFLQDFRPAMQLKLLAQLQNAYEYFPGWISR